MAISFGEAMGTPAAAEEEDVPAGTIGFEDALGLPRPERSTLQQVGDFVQDPRELKKFGKSVGKLGLAAADMVLGLPGQAARVGMDIVGRGSALVKGESRRVQELAGEAGKEMVPEAWSAPLQSIAKLAGMEPWDQSAVSHAIDKGARLVDKYSGGLLTEADTKSLLETVMMAGFANVPKQLTKQAMQPRVNYGGINRASYAGAPEPVATPREAAPEVPYAERPYRQPMVPLAPEEAVLQSKARIAELKAAAKAEPAELKAARMSGVPAEGLATWKSGDAEYPVEVRGAAELGPDGKFYTPVRYQGQDTYVPTGELVAHELKVEAGKAVKAEPPPAEPQRALAPGEIAYERPDVAAMQREYLDALAQEAHQARWAKEKVDAQVAARAELERPASAAEMLDESMQRGTQNRPARGMKGQRGEADTKLLAGLAGLGLTAAVYLALPEEKRMEIAAMLGSAGGLAAAVKGKGGNWHPESAKVLATPLRRNLQSEAFRDFAPEELRMGEGSGESGYRTAIAVEGHASRMASGYLNKWAGVEGDPLRDVTLPDGTKWGAAIDRVISSNEVAGPKGSEIVYKVGLAKEYSRHGLHQLKSYLSHVGDYLRQNVDPAKLGQYDLVRAVKETAAKDEALAKEALKDWTKPNPERIASNDALPTVKSYGPVEEGPRTFSFNKDGSLRQMNEVKLPAETVSYAWKELALPKELTSAQMATLDHVSEGQWAVKDLTGRADFLVNRFTGDVAAGATAHEAWLAGELAKEGNALGHCVGGYCSAVTSGESRILSLRDQQGRSYATVELGKPPVRSPSEPNAAESILQIKGPGNGAPADYVLPYIQDFVKSGKWGEVRDLKNAQLAKFGDKYITKDEARAGAGGFASIRDQAGRSDPRLLAAIAAGTGAIAYLAATDRKEQLMGMLGIGGTIAAGRGRFKGLPEAQVIQAARGGNQAAMARLYEDNWVQVLRTAEQLDRGGKLHGAGAEDLAIMAMTKGLEAVKRGPDEVGGFRGDAKFSTFLHQIVKNLALQGFEKKGRRVPESELTPELEKVKGHGVTPETELQNQAFVERLQGGLDKLDAAYREPFEMRELEGLSYEDIAAKLDVPIGTVRSRISRAKDQLQQHLREYKDLDTGTREPVENRATGRLGTKEGGAVDPELLGRGVIAGGAALLGAKLNEERPWLGALIGAGAALALGHYAKAKDGKGLDWALGNVSTRLGNISPSLKLRARDFERVVMKRTDQTLDRIDPFIRGLKKLPKDAQATLNSALLQNSPEAIAAALRGKPEMVAAWREVQTVLKDFQGELHALGRFAKGLTDYFPRVVKDVEGLKAAIGAQSATRLEALLANAEAQSIKAKGRGLTEIEQSLIINNHLIADSRGSHLPGFAKNRGVQDTKGLEQFYESPTDALLRYVSAAVQDIETARFFGKNLSQKNLGNHKAIHVDESIGNLLQEMLEKGEITREQMKTVESILRARFKEGEAQQSAFWQDVRNVTNIGLLGTFHSAATQIGDSIMTVYHHGLMPTLEATKQRLTGTSQITAKEFGLVNHIAEELGSARASGRALQTVFKYNGFKAIDQFAKGLNLNAGLLKNQALARSVEGRAKLRAKYEQAFGKEDFAALLDDLRARRKSENIERLLFSELSDAQPISKMEMPQAYLENPNGRLLYQMKTYMLKQADVLRRDAYQEIAKGNWVTGAHNLVGFAAALSLSNIPGDIVKDWLSGREFKFDNIDYTENLLRNFGLGRYTQDKLLAGKPVEVAMNMAAPPLKWIDEVYRMDKKTVKHVPLVGKMVYDRALGGNEAQAIAEMKQRRRKERDAREARNPALKAARLERKRQREAKAHWAAKGLK